MEMQLQDFIFCELFHSKICPSTRLTRDDYKPLEDKTYYSSALINDAKTINKLVEMNYSNSSGLGVTGENISRIIIANNGGYLQKR